MMKKLLLYSILMLSAFLSNAQLNIQYKSTLPYGVVTSNIGGFVDSSGNEYALVGFHDGLDIVDVTDPVNPVSMFTVPGNQSNWREVKTWNGYAYVTTEECCDGLQIIDLRYLPDSIATTTYNGDGAIAGMLETIHALHIDNGYVYLYGSNLFNGAAVILDLANPWNPVYLGHTYDSGSNTDSYIHDGYVRNDTMWAGYIYAGYFAVIDATNKANPVTITTQSTPNNFTHNTWLSTDDKTLFTTDETGFSFLASYDITDLSNIKELDRIQSNPGSGVVVHNTHIVNVNGNDFAVTSWYKDGVVITDVGKPDNLVNVGYYDTYPQGTGGMFDGDWGVYPYLPSGNLVCSDMSNGLIVLAPTYVRACYLEGTVTDSVSGVPLNNVLVELLATPVSENSKLTGDYKTGYHTAGTYDVRFSKAGYITKTISGVTLTAGIVTALNVQLVSLPTITFSGQVVNIYNGNPVPNAYVSVTNASFTYNLTADASGNFSVNNFYPQTYDVYAGEWMYRTYCTNGMNITGGPLTIQLTPGVYDDFTFDLGWTISGSSFNSWERGVPVGTTYFGLTCNPDLDVNNDCSDQCFVTDNGGGAAGNNDVDNGNTVLTSPVFDPTGLYANPELHYARWFANTGGSGNPNDELTISISNGNDTIVLETVTEATPGLGSWVNKTFVLSDYITITSTMQVIVETEDISPGHIVEGGFDKLEIVEGPLTVQESPYAALTITASPNPFSDQAAISYDLVRNSSNNRLIITDVAGRIISEQQITGKSGKIFIGNGLPAGVYLVQIKNDDGMSNMLKVIKTK